MFTATGVSGSRNPNGTITVTVQITKDELQGDRAFLARESYTGQNLDDVQGQMQAALDARRAAALDTTLNDVIAGRVLATS